MVKNKTAVEWLVQEINKINVSTEARMFINKLEKQAKEMEKQQITKAYNSAVPFKFGEQYYNETFKK